MEHQHHRFCAKCREWVKTILQTGMLLCVLCGAMVGLVSHHQEDHTPEENKVLQEQITPPLTMFSASVSAYSASASPSEESFGELFK